MLFELTKWLMINLLVAVGVAHAAEHLRLLLPAGTRTAYPWREVLTYCCLAFFCMMIPWAPEPGIQVDLRNTVIALAGWIHGWAAAIPVLSVVVLVRVLIGGPGLEAAVVTAIVNVGLLAIFGRRPRNPFWLTTFALAQVVVVLITFQFFLRPVPLWALPQSPFYAVRAVINVISFLTLNTVFVRVGESLALRNSLARELKEKQAVLELMPLGILLLDRLGHLTSQNQAASTLMENGLRRSALLADEDVAAAVRQRRPLHGHRIAFEGYDGSSNTLLVSAVPVAGGTLIGLEDVTRLVQQEREAAERHRLELLGQLAAMAAHEIKNPLTTIKGFLQLLERRSEFAAHRSSFTLLQGEAEHINRVVSDFLVLSGQSFRNPERVEVDSLISELIEVMKLQHPSSAVQVAVVGQPGIFVATDRKSLTQILKNLIVNAYEAMPSGGTLTIAREPAGDRVRLSISDTGAGIPDEMLPLIFRPYMTTKATGTGLGLAISHKLASELGGNLEAISEQGRGSTFRLLLPADPPLAG